MGITIYYQGTLDHLDVVEALEDRVVDLVFSLGGKATIWRSFADEDSSRVIRGLLVEMAPGQETMSLLISPEGHFINLFEIEKAEKRSFPEPPYCYCKTQFGNVEGHIKIVLLLNALKSSFVSNLQISDESGFHEHRDPNTLREKFEQTTRAIREMSDGLQKFGLSDEAAEDPAILAHRIKRIAQLIHAKLHDAIPPRKNKFESTESIDHADLNEESSHRSIEESVQDAQDLYWRIQRRAERMMRRINERQSSQESIEKSIRDAMTEEGLVVPSESSEEFSAHPSMDTPEPWKHSLDTHSFDDEMEDIERPSHPMVTECESLIADIFSATDESPNKSPFWRIVHNGIFDVMGGLIQTVSRDGNEQEERAWTIVQIRRALRGLAYCRGGVFGLGQDKSIDDELRSDWLTTLNNIEAFIVEAMADAWDGTDF